MKKFTKLLLLLLTVALLFSCSNQMDTVSLDSSVRLEKVTEGKKVDVQPIIVNRYYIKVTLREKHPRIMWIKNIKDNLNEIDLVVPVDKQFYDNIQKGEILLNERRVGSFWISKSFSKWSIIVKDKY